MSARPFAFQKPLVISLHSSRSKDEQWRLRIDGDVLSLAPPNSPPVLTVDNTQAPYCMRIDRNGLGRLTVRFTLVPGLREHTFSCDRGEMEYVLKWLPQKPKSEIKAELHRSAVALVLFAGLHIALTRWVEPTAGLLLLASAVVTLFWVRVRAHAIVGTALLVAGALHLLQWQLAGPVDSAAEGIRLGLGALFLLFGIQQFDMMSPNELLRSARRRVDRILDVRKAPPSDLVRVIAHVHLAAGLLLGAYAVLAIIFNGVGGHPWQIGRVLLPPVLSNADATIGAALGITCLAIAIILPRLHHLAFAEARVSAQFLVGIGLLFAWGIVMSFRFDAPLAFLDGVFANGVNAFLLPQAWATFILAVLATNRIVARAVDRELDHARL